MEKKFTVEKFDAIVVGAGHAAIEAGLALARTGFATLMLSISLDNVGFLACNPSIGGTAKGHLVREIDALGGQMGITADKCATQLRMLNSSKGVSVQSLRAQVDKAKYHLEMKRILEDEPNLILRQAEVAEVLFDSANAVRGVRTVLNQEYLAKVVVVATGVYLDSTIIVGDKIEERGPSSFPRSNYLASSLVASGIPLRRFKTGTPARLHRDSIDLTKLEAQSGDEGIISFSVMTKRKKFNSAVCYLGYTNEETHKVIRENLHLSPKYSGLISGVGARYCPSIEDKIVRFAGKPRHQFFLEPEGDGTKEVYIQGVSTSLPVSVQQSIYHSIVGFENAMVMRDAYAIEYECIDSTNLFPSLMYKGRDGLFFAGQINGTSGYEEAGAQGLMAGINASLFLRGLSPLVLGRNEAYIGVLIDDLVTVGTNEPYRMMTSRAEYRLSLRQDNADLRLTEKGREVGLVTPSRYKKLLRKKEQIALATEKLSQTLDYRSICAYFESIGETKAQATTVYSVIKRTLVTMASYCARFDTFSDCDTDAVQEVFTRVKYEGYLSRQQRSMDESERVDNMALDPNLDYQKITHLRIEAREKLNKIKPLTIGQAGRISGVTPADINVLIIYLSKKQGE